MSCFRRAYFAFVAGALILAACQSGSGIPGIFAMFGRTGPVPSIHLRGARPSYAWRKYGGVRRLIKFPTQIQHVVVIVMENRTVDNLFAAYYGSDFCGEQHNANCGSAMNLYNPQAMPTLQSNSLSATFDPNHDHAGGWWYESSGDWKHEPKHCTTLVNGNCPAPATALSYAPATETGIYAQLLEHWAFADNVLQANEGPSFVAHQYLIAAQSGGLFDGYSSPNAEAENPQTSSPSPEPTGDSTGTDNIDMMTTAGCNPSSGYFVRMADMAIPLPSNTPWDNGGTLSPPCEEYGSSSGYATILDEIASRNGTPPYDDWQYIAHADDSIWAAPLGVNHLYQQWVNAGSPCSPTSGLTEPFICDPDAEQFVSDIGSNNPLRPFANLTFITPCEHESDHPELSGTNDGPEWLIWVVNAIGQSKYWDSTAIIVTWDDWGGWFDHVPAVGQNNPGPVRPSPNKYGVYPDPNEGGFRVPLFVISPYIVGPGYISSPGANVPQYRSQSVILQFIEAVFGLGTLNGDDYQQGQSDGLQDMFNLSPTPSPLTYATITTPPTWVPPSGGVCPTNGNGPSEKRRHISHKSGRLSAEPRESPKP